MYLFFEFFLLFFLEHFAVLGRLLEADLHLVLDLLFDHLGLVFVGLLDLLDVLFL